MVSASQFRVALRLVLNRAIYQGVASVDVNAGSLHRIVGGYPGRDHRMPICCAVMRAEMEGKDVIIAAPPKGQGARLTIRYTLPRSAKSSCERS